MIRVAFKKLGNENDALEREKDEWPTQLRLSDWVYAKN